MADLDRLQVVLRGLNSGGDPAKLLHDALSGAVAASHARQGLLVGMIDGTPTPLASTGSIARVVIDAAEAAATTGRLSRKADRESGLHAVAEPMRLNGRVIGSLAVCGQIDTVDPTVLSLFADAASLVMARRPTATAVAVPEFLDALAGVAADLDRTTVLVRIFDAAEQLFGASGGLCAIFEGDRRRVTVAYERGIDREDLRDASRHPEFAALLTSPGLRVDPGSHPVVSRLARGGETAVGLPLVAEGRRIGHLVLLVTEAPDAATRALLDGFAAHVALSLRSADLYRRIGEKEDQLSSVVHSMPNPVLVVDDQGCFLMVNGAASELFHLAGAFEVGHTVRGKLRSAELEHALSGEDDGYDRHIEVALDPGEGERVYRAGIRRVQASNGRILGRVLVLDDISAERETEQLKADFIAVVGHELRTPLTVMKGYIRTLVRRGAEIEDQARESALASLEANANRLERLIEDLLLVSSIETGRPRSHAEEIDIAKVVASREAPRVEVRKPRRSLLVDTDGPKIEQVLHHLIDNALKYSEGRVVVEAMDGEDEIEISVTDSGPGIFSGDIPNLFNRFKQLDGTSTRAHGGTGIGLYICKRLVDVIGGRIWCESRLGLGTRFAFTIPKHDGAGTARAFDEITIATP